MKPHINTFAPKLARWVLAQVNSLSKLDFLFFVSPNIAVGINFLEKPVFSFFLNMGETKL